MTSLPTSSSDADLLAYVDQWATLLEREAYVEAYHFVGHDPTSAWTPQLICEFIKGYGDANPNQRVTLEGKPTDITQRKKVRRWPKKRSATGEIWYDLNIDGLASDITATFWIVPVQDGLILELNDIHVM